MISAILCAFTGAVQVVLLSKLLKTALSGDLSKTLVYLLLKIMCYGAVFVVLYFFFMEDIYYAAAGFPVGLIVALAILLIKSKKQGKGDDVNEHGGTD